MESHTLYMIHVSSTCAILINRQIHIYCGGVNTLFIVIIIIIIIIIII